MAASDEPKVVVLDYKDLAAGNDLTAQIKEAYGPEGLGILYVKNVPGMQEAREDLLPLARRVAQLPEDVLSKYEDSTSYFNIGWSRGKEKFKGKPDIAKGSFYANPLVEDPSGGDEEIQKMWPVARPNIWPTEVPELKPALTKMGRLVHETAKPIIQQVDKLVSEVYPEHGTTLYDRTFNESNFTVTRLLHYFGVTESDALGDWCGWHNDNSTITGLVPAMWLEEDSGRQVDPIPGAGLFVEGRKGETIPVASPKDCLGFQIGEASQILTGGVVQATPHMVKGHITPDGQPKISRETYAVFIQPKWDCVMQEPKGAGFEDIFRGSESDKIPPLSSRLKATPVGFGELLNQSHLIYYGYNNPGPN
eukprot:CAMPEP_0206451496 /NCGR_PEP_ID=MMETSP0324_2-20121206/19375_1 /ASSEMBLY_ACC=CAM_ASM_000836 /TAXON_ID=2866 /ORGANISM="Crypthecodinium cohnii, Strain Seligo" /LENGTH=363 /DNA_ID=CAMNT_0053921387 /DNA_START=96 /DNA_END=1187 /DNA_ORIENTATION=+